MKQFRVPLTPIAIGIALTLAAFEVSWTAILLGFIAFLIWRILQVVSGAINSGTAARTATGAVIATPRDESGGDDSIVVESDDDEYSGSHIDLYPSQRKFVRSSWWDAGGHEAEYEYKVESDSRIMYRLRHAQQDGIHFSGKNQGTFNVETVKDGVVIEDAVYFVHPKVEADEGVVSALRIDPDEEIADLRVQTAWNELTAASAWPELWYQIVKTHIGEYEARHGIRSAMERLKRGLRIITEETKLSFTVEHDEKYKSSTFKPIDESSTESNQLTMQRTIERSGITFGEARVAYFYIKKMSALLGESDDTSVVN